MGMEFKSIKDHNFSLISGEAGEQQGGRYQLLPCVYFKLVFNFSAEMGTQLETKKNENIPNLFMSAVRTRKC